MFALRHFYQAPVLEVSPGTSADIHGKTRVQFAQTGRQPQQAVPRGREGQNDRCAGPRVRQVEKSVPPKRGGGSDLVTHGHFGGFDLALAAVKGFDPG
jgi:hypothetical protein